ncbi:hypothetical protein AZG96_RS04990 [Acinetobacter baumannii]|nr:hypothetical protein [Acinetobacter baumannii]
MEVINILKRVRNIPFTVKDLAENINDIYEYGMTPESVALYENKAIEIASEILSEIGNINFSQKNFKDVEFHEKCSDFYSENYKLITYIMMLLDSYTSLELCKKDPELHYRLKQFMDKESNSSLIFRDYLESYLKVFGKKLEEIHSYAEKHRIL